MYSTLVYLYNQQHDVLTPDATSLNFKTRWEPVYAKNLKLNRGVDNVILIHCFNQDQKPVNVSDSFFIFRIIDSHDNKILLSSTLEAADATTGKMILRVDAVDTVHIPPQLCSYSITRHNHSDYSSIDRILVEPVFVDDHAGARGVLEVLDSVFPRFIPTTTLSVPELVPTDIYSSEIRPSSLNITTFQFFFADFTGTIQFQAQQGNDGVWYDIESPYVFVAQNGSTMVNIMGRFETLRFSVVIESGTIEKVLTR